MRTPSRLAALAVIGGLLAACTSAGASPQHQPELTAGQPAGGPVRPGER